MPAASSFSRHATAPDVQSMLVAGEGPKIEFKSSMRWDYQQKKTNKDLSKVVAKAVAGFLNATAGGFLLIGVGDDGDVIGISEDIETLRKQSIDGFELSLRTVIAHYLGPELGPSIDVTFPTVQGKTIALVSCEAHSGPVFLEDGERREFYVRDGNRTVPLDVRSTHNYITSRWPTIAPGPSPAEMAELLQEVRDRLTTPQVQKGDNGTPWLTLVPRKVIDTFLSTLAGTPRWQQLYIVSPWISEFSSDVSMSFDQMLARMVKDRTTAYIVTRPPCDDWHEKAIRRLADTGRANIALVPDLHMKLYTARTNSGAFAMLGSANFTQRSLLNKEIGVLVSDYSQGKKIVDELNREAQQIYRTRSRKLVSKAKF